METLRDFDGLWEVLTPRNRQRLVCALVEEVTVDEQNGRVIVRLVDLSSDLEPAHG